MSTIADNIKTLQSIKTDIKSAITEKGGSVDDTFTSYAQAIRDLPSGGGGIDLYSITDKTLSEIDDTKGTITDFDLRGFENLTSINLPQCWSIGYNTLIDPTKLTSLTLSDKLLIYDNFIFNVSGFDISKYSQTACITDNSILYSSLFDSGCFIRNLNSSNMSSYKWQGVFSGAFEFKLIYNVSLPYAWYIGESAFDYASNLISISLPNAWYIGDGAFYYCKSLRSINLPNAWYIGKSVTTNCTSLNSLYLSNVIVIDSYAFRNLSNLVYVEIPKAKVLNDYAFAYCSKLTSISLDEVVSIGNYALANCSSLSSITAPKLKYIGQTAFGSCAMKTLTLPQAINIEKNAFFDCSSLTTITLPQIRYISTTAFALCGSLKSIYVPSSMISMLPKVYKSYYVSI